MSKIRGGRRKNAGRKCVGDRPMSTGIFIRCSPEQKAAIERFVNAYYEGVTISTWMRVVALKASGNDKLI